MRTQHLVALSFTASIILFLAPLLAIGEPFDLRSVKGIETFSGSAAAREVLGKNGFVVADPAFKQIFEPYIKSPRIGGSTASNPMGTSLPSFITTDSAWHTYHVLLEEGVKGMEEIQGKRLANFSRQLWTAASNQKAGPGAGDLVLLTSVSLALQDEHYRQSLSGDAKRIVEGLRTGTSPVEVPIGFSLSPIQLRAQSFYTQSPELSDYFAARQWCANVVFRISNQRETKSAVILAILVNENPELFQLWKQLSDPFDTFLATAEDGTIREYGEVAKVVVGSNLLDGSAVDRRIAEIQKRLEAQLGLPRVSCSLASPGKRLELADFIAPSWVRFRAPPKRLGSFSSKRSAIPVTKCAGRRQWL